MVLRYCSERSGRRAKVSMIGEIKLFVFWWHILILIPAGDCDPFEKQLMNDLLRNYTSLERPVRNHTDPLIVNVKFSLQQIVDVDERNQIIASNAWLDLKWVDYQLRWDRSKYGNLSKIRIPYKYIWTPDILLYNNADNNFDSTTHTSIVIGYKGDCLYVPPGLFKSTCKIDVSNFPFDEQVCKLKFGVWSYNGNQVDLQLQPGGGTDVTEYIESGEWKLTKLLGKRNVHEYKCCPEYFVDITFSVGIRRRTMFYIINLILPCVLNSVLTLLTFVLPAEAAEKVTLAITVLLAQIVFMLLIMETMPPTSDAIPLISKYFACSLITVCASVGGTVLVLSFYYKSPEIDGRMSPTLRKLLLKTFPKMMHMDPFIIADKKFYENRATVAHSLVVSSLGCNGTVPKVETINRTNRKDAKETSSNNNNNKKTEEDFYGCERPTRRPKLQRSIIRPSAFRRSEISSFTSDDLKEVSEDHATPVMQNRSRSKDSYFSGSTPNGNKDTDVSTTYTNNNFVPCKKIRNKSICTNAMETAKALQEILRRLQRLNRKVEQESENNKILLEWQYASRVLDKLLMWIFSLFVVVATLATLFAVPNINDVFTM